VSRLSWDSIGGNCDVLGATCPEGEAAKELVRIGKPASRELLEVLEDKDKGVAAHVILTRIWEPGAKSATRFDLGRRRIISTNNGLEWATVFTEDGVRNEVEEEALTRNAAEWRRKIARFTADTAGEAGP